MPSRQLGRARIATAALWAELAPSALPRGAAICGEPAPPRALKPHSCSGLAGTCRVPQVVWIAIDAVGRAGLKQQDRAGWIFAETAS
jgi:hypothetical protein